MTKSELILKIARNNTGLPQKQIELIISTILKNITQALIEEDKVEIRGFGTFKVRVQKEKIARNPKTGEKVRVPKMKIPFFKPGQYIKEELIKKNHE